MRKTVQEWLDTHASGKGLTKKRRLPKKPSQQQPATATKPSTAPLSRKPRPTKRRKPK